jgi:hypothetical protein
MGSPPRGLGIAEHPRRSEPRLPHERESGLDRRASDELCRDVRPGRVGVAAAGADAREARRASGYDQRADLGAAPGEHDREVRDVAGDQRRGTARLDEVLGDHDDGMIDSRCFVRGAEPRGPLDSAPRRLERGGDGLRGTIREALGGLHRHHRPGGSAS